MINDKLPIKDFAAKIKAKYPQYKDVDDTLLTQRIVEQYPDYAESVDLSPLKKKEPSKSGGQVGSSVVQSEEKLNPNIPFAGMVAGAAIQPEQDVSRSERLKADYDKVMALGGDKIDNNDPIKSLNETLLKHTVRFEQPKSESTGQKYLGGKTEARKEPVQANITPHKASELLKEASDNTFATSADARRWLHREGGNTDPKNETDNLARGIVERNDKVRSLLAESNNSIPDAAFNFYADQDPQLKLLKDKGEKPPPLVQAQLEERFLNDKDLNEIAGERNDVFNAVTGYKATFYENHPQLWINNLRAKIAQAREDYGRNNPFLNLPGKSSSDNEIENLYVRKLISDRDKEF